MKEEKKIVISFLKKNGFKRMEANSYANDYCNVVLEDKGYTVADNEGNTIYLNTNLIYVLVGYLTWVGYLPKVYKQ